MYPCVSFFFSSAVGDSNHMGSDAMDRKNSTDHGKPNQPHDDIDSNEGNPGSQRTTVTTVGSTASLEKGDQRRRSSLRDAIEQNGTCHPGGGDLTHHKIDEVSASMTRLVAGCGIGFGERGTA